jgi:hypothetical protein
MARSRVEMLGLEYEAERLVREGMSRAEVSRMLGVHTQTLAQWALQGRWRKKDLDLERSGRTTKRTIRNIAGAHERRRVERETLEGQARVVREAIRLITEKGPGAAGKLAALIAEVRELPALPGMEAEPRDPKAGTRSLGEASVEGLEEEDRKRRAELRKARDRWDI